MFNAKSYTKAGPQKSNRLVRTSRESCGKQPAFSQLLCMSLALPSICPSLQFHAPHMSFPMYVDSLPPSMAEHEEVKAMAKELRWEIFDGEAWSPAMIIDGAETCKSKEESKSPKAEDFEFSASGGVSLEMEMCAADEVFFQGQLLPLRPALYSKIALFSPSQDSSKFCSRLDSMDHYSSNNASLEFGSCRSISSRSSSCISCVSRSHSSNSFSGATEAHRKSVHNNFYARPSPSPQIISSTRKRNATRSTTTGSWWGLFRLGLMKTPEIELDDLKFRKTAAGKNDQVIRKEKKVFRGNDDDLSVLGDKIYDKSVNKVKVEKRAPRFGGGFSCKCSPNSVDTISSRILITKKKEESLVLRSRHVIYHNRTFEWLKELPLAKEA